MISDLIDKARRRNTPLPPPSERRYLRKRAGLSCSDVAAELKVTPSTVSRWETGDRSPSPSQREAYVAILDALRETR